MCKEGIGLSSEIAGVIEIDSIDAVEAEGSDAAVLVRSAEYQ